MFYAEPRSQYATDGEMRTSNDKAPPKAEELGAPAPATSTNKIPFFFASKPHS